MKIIEMKNRDGVIYNVRKLSVNDIDEFLEKEYHPYKDSEGITYTISNTKSEEEVEQERKQKIGGIKALKNAKTVDDLKVVIAGIIAHIRADEGQ